ncbi:SDR family NAD(P)-dependent oxidoreductase, partial [Streptomyces sp.]
MNSFTGRRVLVVGGTSGVGLATAREFTARGADTVIASRSARKVDTALAALTAGGGKATGLP